MKIIDITRLAQERHFTDEQLRQVTRAATSEQMLAPLETLAQEQRERPQVCEATLAALWGVFHEQVMQSLDVTQINSKLYVPMMILAEYFGHRGDLQAALKCVRQECTPERQALLDALDPQLRAQLANSVQIVGMKA